MKYIKKDLEYIPIIFEILPSEYKIFKLEKKYVDRVEDWDIQALINSFATTLSNIFSKGRITLLYVKGIFFQEKYLNGVHNIPIILVCKKEGQIYIIINETFFSNHTSYLNLVKKSMNSIEGLNSRKHLITMSESEIISRFFDPLPPTIESYKEEVQNNISNEFLTTKKLEYKDIIEKYKTIDLYLKYQFEVGNWVVVLNNDKGGGNRIGLVSKITSINQRQSLWYQVNNHWWYAGDGDIRLAFSDEIPEENKHENDQAFENIKNGLRIRSEEKSELEEEDEEDYDLDYEEEEEEDE